jgi:hypothetical protein
MRERLWTTVHKTAAELVVHHRETSDVNLIEKTMHHIINNNSDFDEVREWLNAQLRYAEYFERSLKTRPQLATTLALIDEFESRVTSVTELAEALGWIIRLTRYYVQRRTEAQRLAPQQSLFVPEPPPLEPVRRSAKSTKARPAAQPTSEETSAFANDFMNWFASRQAEQDEENDEQERRDKKRRKKK